MKINIDKYLLPMKAHYFLFNAGTAPVIPFMPVLAKQLGFSTVVVGSIYTVLPVIGMLAKPIFGSIADKFHKQKLLFLVFQAITALALFMIMFIPPIQESSSAQLHCNNGASDLVFCSGTKEIDENILKNLENYYGNKSVLFDLSCKFQPWMWDIVCENWLHKLDCMKNKPVLKFSTKLNMQDTEVIKNCLYIVLHKAIIFSKETSFFCPTKEGQFFNATCSIQGTDSFLYNELGTQNIDNDTVTGIYQFWMFFILLIISWSGMAVVVSVADAICFELLGNNHHLYGNQRLWGAVGWGLLSLIAGFLVDKFSGESAVKDYRIVFYMALIIISIDMFVSSKLQHQQTKISSNILKDVGKIFLSLRVVIFFIWCILVGLCTALVWNFLFWHLETLVKPEYGFQMNWMKTLQGLVMGVQCFGGELPFFFLSGWLLKKIGHIHAMSLVLFGFGVRFICYSLLTNPWWVLPIELLNGITFGLFYATMASYASIVAPPGTETTMQGIVGAVFEGIGVSLGSLIGGLLFKTIGGSETFRLFGICALVFFVIHGVIQFFIRKTGYSSGKIKDNLPEIGEKIEGTSSSYLAPNDAINMLNDQDVVLGT